MVPIAFGWVPDAATPLRSRGDRCKEKENAVISFCLFHIWRVGFVAGGRQTS